VKVLAVFSNMVIPLIFCFIIVAALKNNQKVFDEFLEGAMSGLKIVVKLIPTLIGLLTAVNMLKASGGIDVLTYALKPLGRLLNIPNELLPFIILRPISGSGSISLLNNLLDNVGSDSMVAKMACTVLASTETTFYTVAVYYGSVGINKTRYTIIAALASDISAFFLACFFIRVLGV